MKTGLILEGGAMRGLFSAGAMDVLMEHGIEFDGAIGVSAGAAFGCNYKSRQPGRVIRYNTRFCKDPRFSGFRSLLRTGDLYGADFCYREMPEALDVFDTVAYNAHPMEFYVVCTDITTGKAVYHRCDKGDSESLQWMRASASMPLVSRVVEIGEHRLLDGGIADSIPLHYFESIGYEKNLLILTQPADYQKRKNPLLPLMKIALMRYPKVYEAMKIRHLRYNETLAYIRKREASGVALAIRPQAPLEIGRVEHDAGRMQQVYQCGRAAAEQQIEKIKSFFA